MEKFKLVNPEVRIEVTNMCGSCCIMCPREKMKRPLGIMGMDLYKNILDQSVGAGAKFVSLGGFGEPFMDPGLCVKAEYARSMGLKVYTITNASLLDEETAEEAVRCFDVIRISMYAATKAAYEKIHCGLDFGPVKRNIERLFKIRKTGRIEMFFLLMDENKDELKMWLNEYEKLADGVSVWKPHNWADGRSYRKPSAVKSGCNRPFTGPLQVQWDGAVVPCCFDYDSRIVLGDLKKETLKGVMCGMKYAALRRAHEKKEYFRYPICDACDQLEKREDVLVYTNIADMKVGATNATHFDLAGDENKVGGRDACKSQAGPGVL